MEHDLVVTYYQGMASVISTLKSYDEVGFFRKEIYDLSLALISPLRADNY